MEEVSLDNAVKIYCVTGELTEPISLCLVCGEMLSSRITDMVLVKRKDHILTKWEEQSLAFQAKGKEQKRQKWRS